MANNFFKGKKSQSEIEQFEDLIRKNPDDDRAYLRLAELYAKIGRENKAIEIYEKAALLFEKKGFLNKAKAVLRQALMINPQHGKINALLADYDRQSGLIKDAAMRYNATAIHYAKMGNTIAAIHILRKMLELYPGNFSLTIKLTDMLAAENMNKEAEKLLVPLAESLKSSDKINEYVTILKRLYAVTDHDSSIGVKLVNLYIKKGSYSNALVVLQKLVLDNPDSIEFLEKLAFVFEKLGETAKLIAIYKQIAVVFSKRKNYVERDNMYRKILELDSNDREALSVLNEDAKLRDIISDKINSNTKDLHTESDNDVDFLIDIESSPEIPQKPLPVNLSTAIKEAKAFTAYRLFDKAIEKIQSAENWAGSEKALDILIESNIELNQIDTAGKLILSLVDLKIQNNQFDEARELLTDAESMLGKGNAELLAARDRLAAANEAKFADDSSGDDIFEAIPDVKSSDEISFLEKEAVKEKDGEAADLAGSTSAEKSSKNAAEPPKTELEGLNPSEIMAEPPKTELEGLDPSEIMAEPPKTEFDELDPSEIMAEPPKTELEGLDPSEIMAESPKTELDELDHSEIMAEPPKTEFDELNPSEIMAEPPKTELEGLDPSEIMAEPPKTELEGLDPSEIMAEPPKTELDELNPSEIMAESPKTELEGLNPSENAAEPPQTRLDELEFYINIEDYVNADQLLKELFVDFPNSKFLSDIKSLIPTEKRGNRIDVNQNNPSEKSNPADDIYDLAIARLSAGMFNEAISLFEKALKINPDSVKCLLGAANALTAAGRLEDALKTLNNAKKLAKDSGMNALIKAQISEIKKSLKRGGDEK